MTFDSPFRKGLLASAVALGTLGLGTAAQAIPILSFGQSGSGNTITGTRSGTTTTITATSTPVTVSQIAGGSPAAPFAAFLNVNLNSTSAATLSSGFVTQDFSGSFCVTSAANCGGTNYLSGTLVDVAVGAGSAFTLNASTPPATDVTFTSAVIPASSLNLERAVGFSFANVIDPLHITNGTIDSFTSSVSATFSANTATVPVPEPVSLGLLGLGLLGLGAVRQGRAA